MTEASSPTVWRRWLAFELTRLRREAGLEQKDVARALRCTLTKVSYIENAERPVVVRDLDEVLLPLYHVPEERWPTYIEAAKNSRKKGWWESYGVGVIAPWFSLYVGLEQGASQIRTYQAQVVPGMLQTPAYTEATARGEGVERREADIARGIEFRSVRQEVLRREPSPLRFWAVLDEAVLRRVVGSRALMKDQLDHLVAMSRLPRVTLQVLSFDRGAHAAMTGPFAILGFPWQSDPGVVYIEVRSGAFYLESSREMEVHTVAFEHLCAQALTPEESVAKIIAVAEEYS